MTSSQLAADRDPRQPPTVGGVPEFRPGRVPHDVVELREFLVHRGGRPLRGWVRPVAVPLDRTALHRRLDDMGGPRPPVTRLRRDRDRDRDRDRG